MAARRSLPAVVLGGDFDGVGLGDVQADAGVLSVRAFPFFSANSAAFAASSMDGAAFELARLGAIVGCLFVAPTVGAKCWYLPFWASRSNGRVERVFAKFNGEWQ
jgi:hypothetical protein